jgi:hypothetical protein
MVSRAMPPPGVRADLVVRPPGTVGRGAVILSAAAVPGAAAVVPGAAAVILSAAKDARPAPARTR